MCVMCREHNVPLVEVLQSYVAEGKPLEAAFSRARSFSKKLDRRGMFVPRGMRKSEFLEGQQDLPQQPEAELQQQEAPAKQ